MERVTEAIEILDLSRINKVNEYIGKIMERIEKYKTNEVNYPHLYDTEEERNRYAMQLAVFEKLKEIFDQMRYLDEPKTPISPVSCYPDSENLAEDIDF